MNPILFKIVEEILNDRGITFRQAFRLYTNKKISTPKLMKAADKIRKHFKNNNVHLCSIVNAKSGNCPEDCGFCAQSAHNRASIDRYPLISAEEIENAAVSAYKHKAGCFGIVTSGKSVTCEKEVQTICRAVSAIKKRLPLLKCSVSIGTVDKEILSALKEAGVDVFHHNLETSEEFFPRMCTTHTYKKRLETIRSARKAGFAVCSGGIFGIGEKPADRIRLAFTIKTLGAESVPLNFLHPIKGTALERMKPLPADTILRTIAIYRLILPDRDIKVCGGREVNLRQKRRRIFSAGANGMMIGNYLTQPGRDPASDLRMIKDLGLKVARQCFIA